METPIWNEFLARLGFSEEGKAALQRALGLALFGPLNVGANEVAALLKPFTDTGKLAPKVGQ